MTTPNNTQEWQRLNKQKMEEAKKNITFGEESYTVRGTVQFEIEVVDVSCVEDAQKVADAVELKLSPWSLSLASIEDQEIDIDEVEELEV